MIKKIKLTNFKCFPSVELSFRELNVFSGVNSILFARSMGSAMLYRACWM